MKYGVSLSTYPTEFGPITFKAGTLEEKLKMAQASGFTGLDLFSHKMSEDEKQVLKEMLNQNHLSIYMFIPFYFAELKSSLTDTDKEKLNRFIVEYKKQIETAAFLGAGVMPIGFIRGRLLETDTLKAYKQRLAGSLRILSAYAKERGVTLCLEPINSNEVNTFYHASDAYDFIKEYDLDDVDLLLDSFQIDYEYVSQTDAIDYCKDRIGHYHLSDTNRLPVGKGNIDFRSIIKKMKEIGYTKCLSMECVPQGDALQSASDAYEHLIRLEEGR